MSDSKRLLKIASQIREHIANMITFGNVSDPRFRDVVITTVKVSPDIGVAKVYFSLSHASTLSQKEVQKFLKKASGFLRKDLSKALTIRHTPELVFYFDETLDQMSKMNELFLKLKKDETGNE